MRSRLAVALLVGPALAQDINHALTGTASQSTTASGGLPQRAIDGNRDSNWGGGSITHTANAGATEWWEVVLPTVQVADEVVIFGRSDCCRGRLANFRVEAFLATQALFTQDFFPLSGEVPSAGLRFPLAGGGIPLDRLRITTLGPGRTGEQVLSLAEVQILQYGAQPAVNVAPFGIATQSTDHSPAGIAARAIDRNTDGFWSQGSVSHTLPGPGAWWRVDLAWRTDVHEIRLWNRVDCCSNRLSNFRLSVFDGPTEVFGQDFHTQGGAVALGVPEVVALPAGTFGTAVQVALLGPGTSFEEVLSLAEVEVIRFGLTPSYTPFGAGCAGSAGTPTLAALPPSRPAIGSVFTARVGNVPAGGFAFLTFGLSDRVWNGLPLPSDLAPFGAPGCRVHASPDGAVLLAAQGGNADLVVAIPGERLLLGTQLFHQALVLDPAAGNALGATVSNAATLRVGM